MADRNERHFLEFYTPARQRIGLLAARRQQINTELQQKTQTTHFSGGKENPNIDGGFAPATIAGEKAAGIGKPRRRLFTRSASKPKFVDRDHICNDERLGIQSNAANAMYGINDTMPETSFSSPPVSGATLSRALFSNDGNVSPMTCRIDENAVSPKKISPPGSSSLLREYRSKQSLLSSSKTRTSTFSSPLTRLRPSSLFKSRKSDKTIEEYQKVDPHDNPLLAAIEKSKANSLEDSLSNIESTQPTSLSPTETVTSSIVETSPTPASQSPITPKTAPKRTTFWSPPGTSKLLRKYRHRTQFDQGSIQSPEVPSQENLDRSKTEPRRIGLRLLDSGAKRCRNRRLTYRPRPERNEVPTPTISKIRAKIKTRAKIEKSFISKANRSLLSPSTAKRLNKDISSYRRAHGKTKLPSEQEVTKKKSPLLEEPAAVEVSQNNIEDHDIDSGLELSTLEQFVPSMTLTATDVEQTVDTSSNDNSTDALPFDEQHSEQNSESSHVNDDSNVETKNPFDHLDVSREEIIPESKFIPGVPTNPSDEETTEGGVFRSTRSASRARHEALAKLSSSNDVSIAKEENDTGGVFRSTRSATRARRESCEEDTETAAVINKDTVNDNSDEDVTGLFRSTRSATRVRCKSKHEDVETPISADGTPKKAESKEEVGVFRSTRSATKARRKAAQDAIDAAAASTMDDSPVDSQTDEDEDSSELSSARSSPISRRKSLADAEKAVLAVEASIIDKSTASAIDNSLTVDADSKSDLPSTPLPQDGNDTPSSKGSLQSIWDVLHCGVGENNIDSSSSENRRDIVSRVGDCVNPMAMTLMKMWREEEKAAVANEETNELFESLASVPPATNSDGLPPTLCGIPPKSFSTDLNLVYGLERVQNLTLARPKALQATRSMTGESTSSTSSHEIVIPPLAPCSQ